MWKPISVVVFAAAVAAVAAAAGVISVHAGDALDAPQGAKPPSAADVIARGRYLVTIAACNDCHTPFKIGPQGPQPDMTRMLSGHPAGAHLSPPPKLEGGDWVFVGSGTNTAFAGPWGVSYAPNLTPDETSGLGAWTEETFVQAMRTGRHWGRSRPIMPPMPWASYGHMTDEDLRAVFAYLRSIPPIHNLVPDSVASEVERADPAEGAQSHSGMQQQGH